MVGGGNFFLILPFERTVLIISVLVCKLLVVSIDLGTVEIKDFMASFIGDYSCKADSKCRIMVPVAFRKVMARTQQTTFVIRKNVFEVSLDMYPYEEWEALVGGLRSKLNLFDRRHAAFMRELYRGVQEVEMDTNGRILLPKRMLEEVGVNKDLILAGQDTKIEVWDSVRYEKMKMGGEEFAKLTQEVFNV